MLYQPPPEEVRVKSPMHGSVTPFYISSLTCLSSLSGSVPAIPEYFGSGR